MLNANDNAILSMISIDPFSPCISLFEFSDSNFFVLGKKIKLIMKPGMNKTKIEPKIILKLSRTPRDVASPIPNETKIKIKMIIEVTRIFLFSIIMGK